MRKIKFRSWDKRNRVMDIPDAIANDIDGDKYQIMQFTGLLDKNRVEIYEGDILRGHYLAPDNVVVVWDTGTCSWDLHDRAGEDYGASEHLIDVSGECDEGANCWEVIGNIYENGYLLEEK